MKSIEERIKLMKRKISFYQEYNGYGPIIGISIKRLRNRINYYKNMQKHTKVYLEYYNVFNENDLRCEVCGMQAVDIHHIIKKSHFGKKTKHIQDAIENLIALCRFDHDRSHFKREPYLQEEELQEIHNNNL